MSKNDFTNVLNILKSELNQYKLKLKQNPSTEVISGKKSLENAIKVLEFCNRYDINSNCKVTIIPQAPVRTPSADFRLIFDNESDKRELWTEVFADGNPIRPLEGSLIIEKK